MMEHIPRIGILASGGGTTAEALARAIHDGQINAEIGLVISSRKNAGILEKVERWNADWGFVVEPAVINNYTHPEGPRMRGQSQEAAEVICELGQKNGLNLFAQLGYMVIGNDPYICEWGFIPEKHSSIYQARAINTHPGTLPLTADTHGDGASELMLTAYRKGEITEAKHSLHVVAEEVDAGPLIAEHPVTIEFGDTKETLFDRIQLIEKAVIGYAIDSFIRGQQEYQNGNS